MKVIVSGDNTYSGPTVVQRGSLIFTEERALPSGGVLIADHGDAALQFIPTETKHLATLCLKQGGTISANRPGSAYQSDVELDADEYLLEAGRLNVSLTGSSTLRKLTSGVVALNYDSPNYSGSIVVEQGTLVQTRLAPHSLGTGETKIMTSGTLVHTTAKLGAGYVRLPASTNLAGGDVSLDSDSTHWDFDDDWRVTANSRLLLFDAIGERELSSPTVNLIQPVSLDGNAALSVLGQGAVQLNGGAFVSGNAELSASEAAVTLASITPTTANATLHLSGAGSFQLPSSLSSPTGKLLTVEIASDAKATNSPGPAFELSDRVTLKVEGRLTNSVPLTLLGGTLTGGGSLQNVANSLGSVATGNGVGALKVANYVQSPPATLDIQIAGTAQAEALTS